MANRKTLEPINTGTVWEFEKGFDPIDFFQALDLLVNDNAIIYLECSSFDGDVLKNLMQHEIDSKYDIYPGTTWPRSNKLHLPLNEKVIKKLTETSKTNATPEYADHLVIYKDEVMIEAYDFCIDSFYMSQRINESIAREFVRRIKSNLRKINLG